MLILPTWVEVTISLVSICELYNLLAYSKI